MKNFPIPLPVITTAGEFWAHYSVAGLAELDFPQSDRNFPRSTKTKAVSRQIRSWHRLTARALKNILAGRTATQLPPLDFGGATEFQKTVWRALLKIPAGKTRSYGEIAKQIGNPKAVRAVGGACGANPIPVLVPCHRVLAANRKLGGFSGGLERKRQLLAREDVVIAG